MHIVRAFIVSLWRFSKPVDRLLALALAGLIIAYRFFFAWLFYGSCRFVPSCSEYALEAIHKHGGFRGAWLASARLTRCQPFHPGGIDPVR